MPGQKSKRTKKKPSLSALERKLDGIFSEYIRRRDADEGGTVRCVTCPRLLFWRDAHAGHFIKRQHRSVRWDERNVASQCPSDNVFKGGCQDEFAAHIIKKYGHEVFDELMSKKHEVCKYTRDDLERLIADYKAKLLSLETQRYPPSDLAAIQTPTHRHRMASFINERGEPGMNLPERGYLRLRQIIGDRKANPPIPALIPVSKTTWWAGVKEGRYPQPVRHLGKRITVWRCADIQALLAK